MATLSEQLKPMIDDLELPGKMGMGVQLNADACKNYAGIMKKMARMVDCQDVIDHSRRQMTKMAGTIIAVPAFLWLMGALFNG